MTEASPNTLEPTPVQLTRMEGILTLIMYKVDALVPRVDRHEQEIADIHLSVQRLSDEAKASAETAVATAKVLKDAREAELAQSDRKWSPWSRMFIAVTFVILVANFATAFIR